ncbi:MAG: cellulase family glycosylhydrolase [Lachnospiraceae bacterium]|nr:cellulase family glycosylhydrolase [Lachnospiraceae bacterium]
MVKIMKKEKGTLIKYILIVIVAAVILAVGIIIGMFMQHNSNTKTEDKKTGIENTKDENTDDENVEDDKTVNGKTEDTRVGDEGTADKSEGPFVLNYSSDNSWQDGEITMYGVNFEIVNNSGEKVDSWELIIEIDGIEKVDGWNGKFSVKDGNLIITNVDYNAVIDNGASTNPGCNLGVKAQELFISYAELNGVECSINKVNKTESGNDDSGREEEYDKTKLLTRSSAAIQGDDWLHTDGRKILDKDGNEMWLTGVNWFGYNNGMNTFDGLYNTGLAATVEAIGDRGFNLIRVPISAQLLNEWAEGKYPEANYNHAYNPELNSMNSLEIFDYFLVLAENNGIKVMLDIHSVETAPYGHETNLWYTDKVSEKEYIASLTFAAKRYKDNDTIIAFDLKNEPHGKPSEGDKAAVWNDSDSPNNWKNEAQKAALAVLSVNPEVLVLVEGIEAYPSDKEILENPTGNDEDYDFNWWGGNLRGVRDYPVELGEYQDKLVYSPHDYGPSAYEQSWFDKDYDYDSLMEDCWGDNWFYIYEEDIAPVLIGEWGGFMSEPNIKWMTLLRKLIKTYRLNHTFWCINPNSSDTGGLLLEDNNTWDEEKYNFVKEVLWQENGSFKGLDHSIPLGGK